MQKIYTEYINIRRCCFFHVLLQLQAGGGTRFISTQDSDAVNYTDKIINI